MAAYFCRQHVEKVGHRHRIAANRKGEKETYKQHSGRNREAGQSGAGQLFSPGQHMIDLHVVRCAMTKHRVEVAR